MYAGCFRAAPRADGARPGLTFRGAADDKRGAEYAMRAQAHPAAQGPREAQIDIRPGTGSAARALGDWMERAFAGLLVIAFGIVLGFQYMAPDRRVLSVLVALLIGGVAWRLEIIASIGVMIMALPFPKGLSFGTTDLALVMLVVVIFMLRVGQRQIARPSGTPLDMPLLSMLVAYVISFYNVYPENLTGAMANFELLVTTLIMFYIVVNSVRTEADLRRLHGFQVMTLILFTLLAFWELTHPGRALVPGWLDFTATVGDVFNTHNVRIGGSFNDYELLADFCGLNILFLLFLFMQARGGYGRGLFITLLGTTVFLLFSTVTRGPIVSLFVAVAYMLWLMRRRLKVVSLTIGAATIAVTMLTANFVVSKFTRSGDLFARLGQTEIKGFAPDTRAEAWRNAWEHFLLHPLIGCGPFYSASRGLKFWFWPHNLYLYIANTIGILGFAFFAWLFVKIFQLTRPRVDTMGSESYVESYLFMARVQFVFFLVDQFKIEYLRNATYQYQVWLMFGLWAAAARLRDQAGHPDVRLGD